MHQPSTTHNGLPLSGPILGPRTSFTLGACALVGTSAWLGAEWLRASWLGLPVGAWLIGAGLGALHLHLTGRLRRDLSVGVSLSDSARAAREWAAATARRAGDAALAAHDRYVLPAAEAVGGASRLRTRLRIGLDLPMSEVRAILDASAQAPDPEMGIDWVRVEAGREDQNDCRRYGLDALIRRASTGALRIAVPEHDGHDAAWHDWAVRPPLSYAAVFPTRIDPAAVTLGDLSLSDPADLDLVMRLASCAAILGRSPARLRVRDRLAGRGSQAAAAAAAPEPAGRWMLELADHVARRAADPDRTGAGAWRAAARAAQAWLVTAEPARSMEDLRRLVEAMDRFLPHEPESLLRVAAARFAAFEDEAGMETLTRAFNVLRASGYTPIADPVPFVMSEIELGSPTPLAVGRVAAGMCLMWATASPRTLEYLRADLIDDLRHAGGAAWRGKDGKLLEDIAGELDTLARGGQGTTLHAAAA